MIKLKVLIPHHDGLLPVVSTKKPSNIKSLLGEDSSRAHQHACSNLLNPEEVVTRFGFPTSSDPKDVYASMPFEHEAALRGANTVK